MTRVLPRAAIVAVLLASGPAQAEETAPAAPERFPQGHGFQFGVRAGVVLSAGNAASALPLADRMGVAPGLAVDLGYRLNRRLYLGGLLAGAPGLVTPTPCREESAGYRCTSAALGVFGAIARLHLGPAGRFDPWVGGGVGFGVQADRAERQETTGGSSSFCIIGCGPTRIEHVRSTTRYGIDAIVEGGIDYRITRTVGVGVAATAFAGNYLGSVVTDRRNGNEVSSDSQDVDSRGHLWVMVAGNLVLNFDPPPPPPPRAPTAPANPPPDPPPDPTEHTL